MFRINLKNDVHFLCASEDTILSGAQKDNITLEYSCKTGRCQSCKAKVIKGTSVVSVDEIGLSEAEKSEGYILTCVRTPTSDLNLDIEDLSAYSLEQVRTLPAKVDKITEISANVIELQLRMPPNASFRYLSGQYINIIKGDYKRSYSIANTNSVSPLVFFIKNYGGGRFSNYLFNKAQINDLLRIEGPIGTFITERQIKKILSFWLQEQGLLQSRLYLNKWMKTVLT